MLAIELEEKLEITQQEYELVRQLVYERAGINLGDNRQHLVQARIAKIIRKEKFSDFQDYFKFLKSDKSGREISHLIDAISTNTTYFFREADHFDFLKQTLLEKLEESKGSLLTVRIWSAASSSGEEPYTIAMIVHKLMKQFPQLSLKMLATDISQEILEKAKSGIYPRERLKNVPEEYIREYFRKISSCKDVMFEISPEIKKLVTFANFNLMMPRYPFKYGFDYVFCRNVMIYFDRNTQENVVNKIAQHIRPGGYLIVGHSESLNGLKHPLKYIKPTIYMRG